MRIVCIGGGTGLYTLLTGLKDEFFDDEISAVVTMMDSGGSTGRLRDEFGYLPPGDVRQSLIALSEAPHEVRLLMQHRFNAPGSSLHGHTVGNIMLTALKDIHQDEYAAIEAMERILRIKGKVYPVTLNDAQLVATLEDGTRIVGEKNIDVPKHDPRLRITHLAMEPRARIFHRTAQVIDEADLVIIGPGDLYTSIMPNLIVEGVVPALKAAKERGARILFVTNTMTKHGETNSFRASDFVRTVQEQLDGVLIDAVIVNTGGIPQELAKAYAAERAEQVKNDLDGDAPLVIADDLISRKFFARHHPHRLAAAVRTALERLER